MSHQTLSRSQLTLGDKPQLITMAVDQLHSEKDAGSVESPTTPSSQQTENEDKKNTQQADHKYPTGLRLGLITLALCLSVFLMALDNSIIATAIPKITDEFHSLPDVGWYGSGMARPPVLVPFAPSTLTL